MKFFQKNKMNFSKYKLTFSSDDFFSIVCFTITSVFLFPLLSLIRVVNSAFEEGHSLMIKVSPFFTKSKSFKAAAAAVSYTHLTLPTKA